ncbi:branched-chain amino acid aminotransferase [Kineococcus xinjiangensis]|uniref:Branched-chain-amino-acid aminotransferase n=1 Tax=Kineococcus xinjiangensis TaxID=512762 RepID=A0A2S6IW35_9ACTN|nr:branched-chain amino acid aminotransferase [Kineococcus xinjiangensis]PPK98572.1 branched-chain amino acid aminotransferase [Kineococcus xinjiangensis]
MSATSTALEFALRPSTTPVAQVRREEILASPGFGNHFTDHMATATWTADAGWHDDAVVPYAPLTLDPAAAVLHYAQEIFEGLKAYRHGDGSVWAFRPEANAARLARSARRLALPELPEAAFLASVEQLVRADEAWVPTGGESSLYLRPFMIATEAFLGVRPAREVRYLVIASPAGSYFSGGLKPVSIWLSEDYTRAAPGGTGAAKCGGNYAASLLPQQEAVAQGCDQVCFLDAAEHRWVEELGGMNLYFVHDDGSIVTPALSGSILEGITRSSILQLAADAGRKVEERRIGIDEWREGVQSGRITEVFACGTAAVVTPVGRLVSREGELVHGGGEIGEVTQSIRTALLDLQYGRAEDTHGWMRRLV